MNKSKNFWKNKNVLITGINGFIGSNLAKYLLKNNANIYGIVRKIDKKTLLYYEKLNHNIKLFTGDIVDLNLIKRIINEESINHIFHLAAQVEVGVAMKYPFSTFESNIKGTYTVLEAARTSSTKIESIIVASSDKSYGEYPSSKLPYKENYALNPKFFYDTSKACADMITKSYALNPKKSLPIIITRFANIFGPGQMNFSALIPDCIRSSLKYTKFEPRGNGKDTRDFLFVEDVAEIYEILARELSNNKNLSGNIFNAGTNEIFKVEDIIKKIFIKNKNKKDLVEILSKLPTKKTEGEIKNQLMTYDKLYKFFRWKPKTTFDKGLDKTLNWYKKFLKYDTNNFTSS
jgi:CDP-glucose 4,6-dehydratase